MGANPDTATAILVTHISAATGALGWMVCEWRKVGKPIALGIVTGSIAGLAAITPASGSVGPLGAIVIGAASTVLCYWICTVIKSRYQYDDFLDVFGVHGVEGFAGTVLVAFFGSPSHGGKVEGIEMGKQLGTQVFAAIAAAIFTIVVTFVILKILKATIGLKVEEQDEVIGLDLSDHGESGYND